MAPSRAAISSSSTRPRRTREKPVASLDDAKIALYGELLQKGPEALTDDEVEIAYRLSGDRAIQTRLDEGMNGSGR